MKFEKRKKKKNCVIMESAQDTLGNTFTSTISA